MKNINNTKFYTPTLGLRLLLILCTLTVYLPLLLLPQLAHTLRVAPGVATSVISAFGLTYATGFMVFGRNTVASAMHPV